MVSEQDPPLFDVLLFWSNLPNDMATRLKSLTQDAVEVIAFAMREDTLLTIPAGPHAEIIQGREIRRMLICNTRGRWVTATE